MITRPLDLASRLAPPPRNFDLVFLVNAGLLVLFFLLFGSRFVLAPGLRIPVPLPQHAGARASATRTTCHLRILNSGQILTDEGMKTFAQLPDWLGARARGERHPVLLVLAGGGVPVDQVTRIYGMASDAKFAEVVLGAEEPQAPAAAP